MNVLYDHYQTTESAVSSQLIAQHQLQYIIEKVLYTFDKGLAYIPDYQLDYRPSKENMSAKELGYHVYQVCLLLTLAVKEGFYASSHLDTIPFDTEQISTSQDIIDYGQQVKVVMRQFLHEMNEIDLTKEIALRKNLTGFDALMMLCEEVMHHRGQLMLYIRQMGVRPPSIYDYS